MDELPQPAAQLGHRCSSEHMNSGSSLDRDYQESPASPLNGPPDSKRDQSINAHEGHDASNDQPQAYTSHHTSNDPSPIAKLPVEILLLIFKLHATLDPPSYYRLSGSGPIGMHKPPPPVLGWFVDLHVSRHWRQVALSHPLLWTRVPLCLGKEWANQVVSLSGSSPLIVCDDLRRTSRPSYDILPAILHRSKRLLISGTQEQMRSVVDHLSSPAPILEKLALMVHESGRMDLGTFRAPHLLANHAPQLRTIRLDGITLLWYSDLFIGPDRVELCADMRPRPGFDIPRLYHQLSHISHHSPSLRHLAVRQVYREDGYPYHTGPGLSTSVQFTALEYLRIEGELFLDVMLLNYLRCPQTCRLALHCYIGDDDYGQGEDFPPFEFPARFNVPAQMLPLRTLWCCATHTASTVSTWRSSRANRLGTFDPKQDADVEFSFSDERWLEFLVGWTVRTFCAALPLENVEDLALNLDSLEDPLPDINGPYIPTHAHPFFSCVRLKHLWISGVPPRGLFVTEDEPEEGLQLPDSIPFPDLQSIHLTRVSFESRGQDLPVKTFAKLLKTWLDWCFREGHELDLLILDECEDILESTAREMYGKIVRTVAWRAQGEQDKEFRMICGGPEEVANFST
ncbi:hypothetical protein BC834DRAFT_931251 [Gloeopeniophorella convolvens]|nr:hypothetical protein BC834DRAFT_931251 [Gloeopeniophorella convolvens]